MLEIVINNPSDRKGEGIINTSSAFNGCFCYIEGFNADGETLLNLPNDSAQASRALYPINKYYYPEDLSDTSDAVDKRALGDSIVYFTGEGEYITDKFCPATFGLDDAYWDAIEGGLTSSAYGAKITSPGSSTSNAAVILATNWKCWVATGNARGTVGALRCDNGYLVGTSVGTFEDEATPLSDSGYVARVMRIMGSDSADAKIHFRLTPMQKAVLS